jgi:preflagellin peptidase FlaK
MEEWHVLASLAMLSVASAADLKSRSVSDWLWVAFAAAAAALYVAELPAQAMLPGMALSIALTAALSFASYRAGLFGGADALTLFVLALLMPQYSGSLSLLGRPSPLFPLAVLANALALSACQVLANVARNAMAFLRNRDELFVGFEGETAARKAVAFMVGFKSANPLFSFPMERSAGAGKKFDFAFRNAETADYETGKNVWVTPGLPFLLYLAAGFIVAVLAGDITGVISGAFS